MLPASSCSISPSSSPSARSSPFRMGIGTEDDGQCKDDGDDDDSGVDEDTDDDGGGVAVASLWSLSILASLSLSAWLTKGVDTT